MAEPNDAPIICGSRTGGAGSALGLTVGGDVSMADATRRFLDSQVVVVATIANVLEPMRSMIG